MADDEIRVWSCGALGCKGHTTLEDGPEPELREKLERSSGSRCINDPEPDLPPVKLTNANTYALGDDLW